MSRKLKADIEACKLYEQVESVQLNDDDTVTLAFKNQGPTFSLVITDDYPTGDTFYFCIETSESGAVKGNLENMYKQLLVQAQKIQHKTLVASAANKNKTNNADSAEDGMKTSHQQDGGGGGDDESFSGMDSQTETSGVSHGMMENQDSSAGWDRANSLDDVTYGSGVDPALQRDMDICAAYGVEVTVDRVALGSRISLPIVISDLINQNTALAWGVNHKLPLVVQLRFERPEYVKSTRHPEVFVFQNGTTCRFGQQVRNFLEMYLHENWDRDTGFKPPRRLHISSCSSSSSSSSPSKEGSRQPKSSEEQAILLLSATQRLIYEALQRQGYDDVIAAAAAHQSKTKEEALRMCADGTVLSADSSADTSQGWLKQLKEQHGANADPNKYTAYDPEEGFLLHVNRYVRHRVPTSFRYCTICDKKHLIGAGMLKPSVCERQLCTYAFQQLKVGKDTTDSVATGGGVIDLLVAMFRTACLHSRAEFVLNPYPSVTDSAGKLIFDPKHKDLGKLRDVTKELPQTKDFIGIDNLGQLANRMSGRHPACLPLLEWIISSNRSLIVKLHQNQRLARMHTPHQFFLITASEEKQKKFEARKASKGTKFGWHGSRIENWHSILRVGLKVMSGTKGQLNGAAHGTGVYFANDAATSLGYSQAAGITGGSSSTASGEGNTEPSNNGSSNSSSAYFDGSKEGEYACLALCEIVADSIKDHGWCFTVDDEDAIMTRFFFVFTNSNDVAKANSANTTDGQFINEIKALIAAS